MTPLQQAFAKDGVVFLAGALDGRAMQLAEDAFRWSLSHPGPGAGKVLAGTAGEFFQDHANPAALPVYRELLVETRLPDIVCETLGSEKLWLLYEQIWLKDGGETRRTPWHQDLAYVPMSGDHLATVWLNLDPVPRQHSLEFVPGSHRGPLFNPTAFDAHDLTASMFPDGVWPSLPDIEADRAKFTILSWEIQRGDIIIFHPALLHGGAPTFGQNRRRTISLRFFGDHAYCAERPECGLAEIDRLKRERPRDAMEQMALRRGGTLFRHADFPQLR